MRTPQPLVCLVFEVPCTACAKIVNQNRHNQYLACACQCHNGIVKAQQILISSLAFCSDLLDYCI